MNDQSDSTISSLPELLKRLKDARRELAQAQQESERFSTLGTSEDERVEQFRRTGGREERELSAEEIFAFRASTAERKEIERIRRSIKELQATIGVLWAAMQRPLDQYRASKHREDFELLDRLSPALGLSSIDRAIAAVEKILTPTEREAGPTTPLPQDAPANRDDLLAGKEAVSYKTAAKYLGISIRHVRGLATAKKLEAWGEGQQKKITTESLRRYGGAVSTNPEQSGTKRN
jgi:hypothetical protein